MLIVDDHDLFRTGLRNLLEEQGVDIVGEADNGTRALEQIRETAPDVVVMDLNMPGISGVEATRQISMIAPLTRVLVARMRWSTFAAMFGEISDSPSAAARMPAIRSWIEESLRR